MTVGEVCNREVVVTKPDAPVQAAKSMKTYHLGDRVKTLLGDAALLGLIVIALPLAILLVGTPIVILVRLLIAIAQRLL